MPAAPQSAPVTWRRYVDLLAVLTAKEIKVRYKRTALGYLWSLLNPLVYAITFWFAFKAILNVKIENYFVFLLAGLFPWQWFANTLQVAPAAFLRNGSLVKKVLFPRYLIVGSVVLTEGVHFLLCLPVFAVVAWLSAGYTPHIGWLWGIPILTFVEGLIIYGVAVAVAAFNVFLRDIERLIGLVVTVLFYMTPVIYRMDMVPASLVRWVTINPMSPIIVGWRDLLIGHAVDYAAVARALPAALAVAIVGHLLYTRVRWQLAEHV
ncbi:MAG: ABC transporter permease [Proteobacteria bacterium]|nr:ABC transporter permease [Pseudomonadota bacterium]